MAAVVVFQDITERKQAEVALQQQAEALENQQKWLESVLDLMPTPMVFIEPETAKVTFSNRIADELAGREIPKNKSLEEYSDTYYCTDANGERIPTERMPGVLIARGERLENYEVNWHTTGGIRSTLCWGEILPAMYGHPAIGICMFQDVTRLKQIETEQQFLIELNDAIRAIQDPQEIVWRVVCGTGKYFNITRCTYGDIDSTQEYVIVERDYCNGVISVAGSHQMNSFGPEIIAELKQGKTIVVDDVDSDPRTAGLGATAFNAIQTKSLLCVPLVKQGRFMALFVLHHVSPRHWTAADVALMERIAQKTWLAVERSRAEEKLRESEAYLQFALKVGRMGTWNWDMQTGTMIFRRTLQNFRSATP